MVVFEIWIIISCKIVPNKGSITHHNEQLYNRNLFLPTRCPKNVSDSYPVVPNLHVKSADGYPVTIR